MHIDSFIFYFFNFFLKYLSKKFFNLFNFLKKTKTILHLLNVFLNFELIFSII